MGFEDKLIINIFFRLSIMQAQDILFIFGYVNDRVVAVGGEHLPLLAGLCTRRERRRQRLILHRVGHVADLDICDKGDFRRKSSFPSLSLQQSSKRGD